MAHVLHYAFKSTQATVQLVLATVLGVLAVLLLFSTVFRWRYESTLRGAIQEYGTSDGDPLALLEEARTARPDDLLPHLFVGQILLERGTRLAQEQAQKGETSAEALGPATRALEGSIKAFDTACARREKVPSSSESAPVGACCARLALADLDAGRRASLLDEAGRTLDTQVREKDDVDVILAAAGLAFAKGDYPGCGQKLSDAGGKLQNGAGRGAIGSYYWHKGLLGLMKQEPGAFDDLRRASLYRRGPATAKAVALAFRVATADTSFKDPKELEARLVNLGELLAQRGKTRQRYDIEKDEEAACWNALGVAWMRVPNAEKAAQAFQRAVGNRQDMVLYKVNGALSIRGRADLPPDNANPEVAKRRFDSECANALMDVMGKLDLKNESAAEKEVKEKYARDLLLLSVGLFHSANKDAEAGGPLVMAHAKFALEDKEFYRTQGALNDWLKRLDVATPLYKKAIAAGHRESYKMQERVDLWERKR